MSLRIRVASVLVTLLVGFVLAQPFRSPASSVSRAGMDGGERGKTAFPSLQIRRASKPAASNEPSKSVLRAIPSPDGRPLERTHKGKESDLLTDAAAVPTTLRFSEEGRGGGSSWPTPFQPTSPDPTRAPASLGNLIWETTDSADNSPISQPSPKTTEASLDWQPPSPLPPSPSGQPETGGEGKSSLGDHAMGSTEEFLAPTPFSPPNSGPISPLSPPTKLRPDSRSSTRTETLRSQTQRHRIVNGDSLPELAKTYLDDPGKALQIYQANHKVLPSPEILPIGVELVIPPK